MKIVTVVGARPQFIKAAAVSRQISLTADIEELIVHTGQHFDENMSRVFFEDLQIPEPDYNLGINSLHHGAMTGRMLEAIENILLQERPDWMLVYGDTNSTIAGALAARKLNINVAHVEAGLRSFNNRMPEEINRVLTDRISDLLFCPSSVSADYLKSEGIVDGVHIVGDVMYDALLFNRLLAEKKSSLIQVHELEPGHYHVATIHRAENTDDKDRMTEIVRGIGEIGEPFVLPLHPRTKNCLRQHGLSLPSNVTSLPPLSYLDMIRLVENAKFVFTDSGGLQKEAYWLGKPCITMRDETEWTETVDCGWNRLTGGNAEKIGAAFADFSAGQRLPRQELYGDGKAAHRIVGCLTRRES